MVDRSLGGFPLNPTSLTINGTGSKISTGIIIGVDTRQYTITVAPINGNFAVK